MENRLFKLLFVFLAVCLTINVFFNLSMNIRSGIVHVWAGDSSHSHKNSTDKPAQITKEKKDVETPLINRYLSEAEQKYLSKSRQLVKSVEILGLRVMQIAPTWWDEYHPILIDIESLAKDLKRSQIAEEKQQMIKEFYQLETDFNKVNERIEAFIRRFFAEADVAHAVTRQAPHTMSGKGKIELKKSYDKLVDIEKKVRAALWSHHILENPNDKRNGWSCRVIIHMLLGEIHNLFFSRPLPNPAIN